MTRVATLHPTNDVVGTGQTTWFALTASVPNAHFLPMETRAARGTAPDNAWRIVLVEDLEQLGSSVGLERPTCVFRQTQRVTRPGCRADLDQHMRNLVTAGDLP